MADQQLLELGPCAKDPNNQNIDLDHPNHSDDSDDMPNWQQYVVERQADRQQHREEIEALRREHRNELGVHRKEHQKELEVHRHIILALAIIALALAIG
jgi:hypothetical protein